MVDAGGVGMSSPNTRDCVMGEWARRVARAGRSARPSRSCDGRPRRVSKLGSAVQGSAPSWWSGASHHSRRGPWPHPPRWMTGLDVLPPARDCRTSPASPLLPFPNACLPLFGGVAAGIVPNDAHPLRHGFLVGDAVEPYGVQDRRARLVSGSPPQSALTALSTPSEKSTCQPLGVRAWYRVHGNLHASLLACQARREPGARSGDD
jgi:hypothetical protein